MGRRAGIVFVAMLVVAAAGFCQAEDFTGKSGLSGGLFLHKPDGISSSAYEAYNTAIGRAGDFEDFDYSAGACGEVRFGITPSVVLALGAAYWPGSLEDPWWSGTDGADSFRRNGEISCPVGIAQVSGIYYFPTEGEIVPYIGGGVGYYHTEVELDYTTMTSGTATTTCNDERDDSGSAVGFHAVAGLEILIGENIGLYGEIKYVSAKIDDAVPLPTYAGDPATDVSGDLDFSGVSAGAGLRLYF